MIGIASKITLKLELALARKLILLHSAGVGRTGTIILIDACLRMALDEGALDAFKLLQVMRNQRANLVDNAVHDKMHLKNSQITMLFFSNNTSSSIWSCLKFL
jgi:protein tyrosine phosphatase